MPGAPESPYRNARYARLDVPGPMPMDMVRAVPRIRRDPLRFLADLVARYGDLVAFPMPRGTTLLVNDPDAVRRVLVDNHRAYGKRTVQYDALAQITGQGLLAADTDVWRPHRRVLQPAFHHAALEAVAGHATSVAVQLRAAWDVVPGGLLDADHAIMEAMLDLVGRTLFATDLGREGAVDGADVVRTIDRALRLVVARAASPVPGTWPTPGRRRLVRAIARLDAAAAEIVRCRRARGSVSTDGDLLALLLQAQNAGVLDEREVRDELLTMIIAGHETVASSLTWTLHLLAGHPEVAEGVAAELDAVLLGGRVPIWDDLPRLRFTRSVVDEALRLYPPAWVITRRALADDELCGVAIPAGTLVILSPWLLHRRPDAWPDPERFDPGRFAAASGRAVPAADYLPFGLGPRLCIGRDAALVEAILVLATLLSGRRVVAPDGAAPPAVDALVTLRPRGGLPLMLLPRPTGGPSRSTP